MCIYLTHTKHRDHLPSQATSQEVAVQVSPGVVGKINVVALELFLGADHTRAHIDLHGGASRDTRSIYLTHT